ncbi:hypothetical protein [Mesorhizobium sp. 1M-11]|uniref:hypothetical protein n=1 Tax=Mesorhizobium sp. 1M-11 TaxID=1529006 RepID=UPI000A4476C3|nr:hypothetical protein [Mesorhizobium sp. 1M-11]
MDPLWIFYVDNDERSSPPKHRRSPSFCRKFVRVVRAGNAIARPASIRHSVRTNAKKELWAMLFAFAVCLVLFALLMIVGFTLGIVV